MNEYDILKQYYGYEEFHPGQHDIIQTIMSGSDVLVVMPTGAGKSLCYQIPALMLPGITIVVSPLISLMQDQVKALRENGIDAAFINSSLTAEQISDTVYRAAHGEYKILYVAPERLQSATFMNFAAHVDISLVAVDEAHCISQWGQDFRPSYLEIVHFVEDLKNPPIIAAFTATATEDVRNDIISVLRMDHPSVFVTGFDRPNLYFRVEQIRGKKKDSFILDYIRNHADQSGIIYCATRRNTNELYDYLAEKGVSAVKYHAGMDSDERKRNQDDFVNDRVSIIIATNAFGMGIDKSDVRFVIHYNMPQSIENYYQEAGRAGRDGLRSECILLYSRQDTVIAKFLLESKNLDAFSYDDRALIQSQDMNRLYAMTQYCKTTGCLRKYILDYFGETTHGNCDNCGNCHRSYQEEDVTENAKQMINCVYEMRGRYGSGLLFSVLKGSRNARVLDIQGYNYRSYGALKDYSNDDFRELLDKLIDEGYLCQSDDKYGVIGLGDYSGLKNGDRVIVRKYKKYKEKEIPPGKPTAPKTAYNQTAQQLTSDQYRLFEKLRSLRLEIAREKALPPYIIFSDKTLRDMCVRHPSGREEMLAVNGVGERKYAEYGERFLAVINSDQSERPPEKQDRQEMTSSKPKESGRKTKPENAGSSWSENEDTLLKYEYEQGLPVSSIAKIHHRTNGAIRSRLKKLGLTEQM